MTPPSDGPVRAEPTPSEIFGNPGLLKLELIQHGVRLDASISPEIAPPARHGPAFVNAWDLDLILPQETWISVPTSSAWGGRSSYLLRAEGDGHALVYAPEGSPEDTTLSVPVEIPPRSPFYERTTATGIPLSRLGSVHGSHLALSPISECSFVGTQGQCRFCSLDGMPQDRVPVDDVIEAIRIANEHRRIEMVFLNVGHLPGEDSGIRALEPYIRAIKRTFDILVAVDALPPKDNAWIDRTYAMGVDSVSYNLEIFDPDRFATICPGPARDLGRGRYLEALAHAATVFPSGATICHLIVGLEPLESTRAGIETLTAMGVVPVLPIHRPFKGIDMRQTPEASEPFSTRELSDLYGELYQQLRDRNIQMRWVRGLSVATTPAEGRFFVMETGLSGLLARIGDRAPSSVLSDWRRALRVQKVDGSFKSSGL